MRLTPRRDRSRSRKFAANVRRVFTNHVVSVLSSSSKTTYGRGTRGRSRPAWRLALVATVVAGVLAGSLFYVTRPTQAAAITISANTNWSAIVTGSGPLGQPNSTDTITITNGATLTVNVTNGTCASIQIGTTASSNTGTLSFSGPTSQVTVSGTVTVGGAGGSGRAGSINMASGGTLIAQALAVNTAGTWTPGTGTVQLTANNTIPNAFFTTFNNLTINGGTTTLGGDKTVSGTLSVLSGTFDQGATFNLTSATTSVSSGATFQKSRHRRSDNRRRRRGKRRNYQHQREWWIMRRCGRHSDSFIRRRYAAHLVGRGNVYDDGR